MDILPFTYIQYAPQLQESYDSPSQAIDIFYFERDKADRIRQHSSDLYKLLKRQLEHNENKLGIQRDELNRSKNADQYRLWGELITQIYIKYPKGF